MARDDVGNVDSSVRWDISGHRLGGCTGELSVVDSAGNGGTRQASGNNVEIRTDDCDDGTTRTISGWQRLQQRTGVSAMIK